MHCRTHFGGDTIEIEYGKKENRSAGELSTLRMAEFLNVSFCWWLTVMVPTSFYTVDSTGSSSLSER